MPRQLRPSLADLRYALEHVVLPSCTTMAHPMLLRELQAAPQPATLLHLLLLAEQQCIRSGTLPDTGDEPSPSVDAWLEDCPDIPVQRHALEDAVAFVLQMPSPDDIGELFHCACVMPIGSPGTPQLSVPRYFTLERGSSPSSAMLCEWTAAGEHHNYGQCPPSSADDFVRNIGAILARS